MANKNITITVIILLVGLSTFVFANLVKKENTPQTSLGANFPGDCGGPNGTPDGFVDLFDFGNLSRSFGLTQGQPGFNAACDFYHDAANIIDLFDYQILANNFGRAQGTPTPPAATTTPGPTPPGTVRIQFSPSNEDIKNPERGFYKQSSIWVDQPYTTGKLTVKDPTDSLAWIYFHLDNYRDPRDGPGVTLTNYQGKLLEPVGSGKGLDTVKKTFDDARAKGLKLVIRFMYVGYPGIGSNTDPNSAQPDAPLSLVQQHISQLAPLFSSYKDVISAYQFGFVGYFGEWHSSKYLYSLDSRHAVMNAMLAGVPRDRMIEVRYPRYKQAFFGGPLTEANSFNESDLSRIGYFDDAFLKDDTDDGTFKSTAGGIKATNYCDNFPGGETACWRDYINKDSRFVAVSGEAGTHSTTPSTLQLCPNALTQLANMHFNSIHNSFSMTTLNAWTNGGCMPEIRRRLGYRFELKEAFLNPLVQRGGNLYLQVKLSNTGFGPLFNPRPLYIVLTGPNRYELPLNVNPQKWLAGTVNTFTENVNIPTNISPGIYKLGLWLPDSSNGLKTNADYSVRFANLNTWDQATGINILTDNFIIQ